MMSPGLDLLVHAVVGISRNPNLSQERAEIRVLLVLEQYFHLTSDGMEYDRAGTLSGTPKAPGVGVGLLNTLKGR